MADMSTKDLTALCGIKSIQGMIQWVKKHIDRLNIDGDHVRKIGNEWVYDEVAVERILEIRNKGTMPTQLVQETERVKELVAENKKLLEKLTVAQAAIMNHKDKIISVQANYVEQIKLLNQAKTEAEQSYLEAQTEIAEARADKTIAENKLEAMEIAYKDKLEHLEAINQKLDTQCEGLTKAIEELKQQGAMLIAQVNQLRSERDSIKAELEAERHKSFFKRLFG